MIIEEVQPAEQVPFEQVRTVSCVAKIKLNSLAEYYYDSQTALIITH